MKKISRTILIFLTLAAAFSFVALAEETRIAEENISIARQLRLKRQIMMGQTSLLATLQQNRQRWENCSQQQKQLLRQRAYAFKNSNPENQHKLIRAMEKFNSLSPQQQDSYRQRAAWLKTVMSRLNDSERQRLNSLPPSERAREILSIANQM